MSCGFLLGLDPPEGKPLPDAGSKVRSDGGSSAFPDAGKVAAIWSGVAHMCATFENGSLVCWGTNASGQLGVGDSTDKAKPVLVNVPSTPKVGQVSVGMEHTCAIDGSQTAGALFCWGKNSEGQLGLEDKEGRTTPARTSLNDIISVQAGESHTCALTSRQTIFCWGSNEWGTLGTGRLPLEIGQSITKPELVAALFGTATALADGYGRHACALATVEGEKGRVYCWGYNAWGQLGDGTNVNRGEPVRVLGIVGAKKVRIGLGNTCVQLEDDSYRCWGENSRGQLGNGTRSGPQLGPGDALNLPGIVHLNVGFSHSCATDTKNVVRCWGGNDRAQLGLDSGLRPDGAVLDGLLPAQVTLPPVEGANISGRGFTTCVRTTTGDIRCWGANGASQLLTGDALDRFSPIPLNL